MNEQEARKDAEQNYVMAEWLQGERDALAGVTHESKTISYDAGYSFGIWKQEMKAGK